MKIEIQGADFSREFEDADGRSNRLSVHFVFDQWPPRELRLHWQREADGVDETVTFAPIARGPADVVDPRVGQLERAIELYLERPGCNSNQRRLALRRLAFAAGLGE